MDRYSRAFYTDEPYHCEGDLLLPTPCAPESLLAL